MELKVWVDGIQRIVCGVTHATTCQDVVFALAHATSTTGRFTLIERWRSNERLLAPTQHPLKVLLKWGEHASDVQFILQRTALDSQSNTSARAVTGHQLQPPQQQHSSHKNPLIQQQQPQQDVLNTSSNNNNQQSPVSSAATLSQRPLSPLTSTARDIRKSLTFSGGALARGSGDKRQHLANNKQQVGDQRIAPVDGIVSLCDSLAASSVVTSLTDPSVCVAADTNDQGHPEHSKEHSRDSTYTTASNVIHHAQYEQHRRYGGSHSQHSHPSLVNVDYHQHHAFRPYQDTSNRDGEPQSSSGQLYNTSHYRQPNPYGVSPQTQQPSPQHLLYSPNRHSSPVKNLLGPPLQHAFPSPPRIGVFPRPALPPPYELARGHPPPPLMSNGGSVRGQRGACASPTNGSSNPSCATAPYRPDHFAAANSAASRTDSPAGDYYQGGGCDNNINNINNNNMVSIGGHGHAVTHSSPGRPPLPRQLPPYRPPPPPPAGAHKLPSPEPRQNSNDLCYNPLIYRTINKNIECRYSPVSSPVKDFVNNNVVKNGCIIKNEKNNLSNEQHFSRTWSPDKLSMPDSERRTPLRQGDAFDQAIKTSPVTLVPTMPSPVNNSTVSKLHSHVSASNIKQSPRKNSSKSILGYSTKNSAFHIANSNCVTQSSNVSSSSSIKTLIKFSKTQSAGTLGFLPGSENNSNHEINAGDCACDTFARTESVSPPAQSYDHVAMPFSHNACSPSDVHTNDTSNTNSSHPRVATTRTSPLTVLSCSSGSSCSNSVVTSNSSHKHINSRSNDTALSVASDMNPSIISVLAATTAISISNQHHEPHQRVSSTPAGVAVADNSTAVSGVVSVPHFADLVLTTPAPCESVADTAPAATPPPAISNLDDGWPLKTSQGGVCSSTISDSVSQLRSSTALGDGVFDASTPRLLEARQQQQQQYERLGLCSTTVPSCDPYLQQQHNGPTCVLQGKAPHDLTNSCSSPNLLEMTKEFTAGHGSAMAGSDGSGAVTSELPRAVEQPLHGGRPDGGTAVMGRQVEHVVLDGIHRDLVNLVNLQRDKLTGQQVQLTKFEAEITYLEGRWREDQAKLSYATAEMERLTRLLHQLDAEVYEEESQHRDQDLGGVVSRQQQTTEQLAVLRRQTDECDTRLQHYCRCIRSLESEMLSLRESSQLQQVMMDTTEALLDQHQNQQGHEEDDVELTKQLCEVEALLAGRREEVESLRRAVMTENLQALSLAQPDTRVGRCHPSAAATAAAGSGSSRRIMGSPRMLETAVPTSRNPHGVWV